MGQHVRRINTGHQTGTAENISLAFPLLKQNLCLLLHLLLSQTAPFKNPCCRRHSRGIFQAITALAEINHNIFKCNLLNHWETVLLLSVVLMVQHGGMQTRRLTAAVSASLHTTHIPVPVLLKQPSGSPISSQSMASKAPKTTTLEKAFFLKNWYFRSELIHLEVQATSLRWHLSSLPQALPQQFCRVREHKVDGKPQF